MPDLFYTRMKNRCHKTFWKVFETLPESIRRQKNLKKINGIIGFKKDIVQHSVLYWPKLLILFLPWDWYSSLWFEGSGFGIMICWLAMFNGDIWFMFTVYKYNAVTNFGKLNTIFKHSPFPLSLCLLLFHFFVSLLLSLISIITCYLFRYIF